MHLCEKYSVMPIENEAKIQIEIYFELDILMQYVNDISYKEKSEIDKEN